MVRCPLYPARFELVAALPNPFARPEETLAKRHQVSIVYQVLANWAVWASTGNVRVHVNNPSPS